MIKRTIINSRPPQTEYTLTDKGVALELILAHVAIFSTRFEPNQVFKDERPRLTIKQISKLNAYQISMTIEDKEAGFVSSAFSL